MSRLLRSLCIFLVCWMANFALSAPPVSDQPLDILIPEDAGEVPSELTFRARVTAITPAGPSDIDWRWGGEGLGGDVYRGKLGENLAVGQWSPSVAVASVMPKGKRFPKVFFLTITVGRGKATGAARDVRIEFEFSYKDKVVKTFTEAGPNGGTVGLVIPVARLGGGKTPDSPEFLNDLVGILTYAQRRAERLEALPWADKPLPKKYAILTDLGGYGEGAYYGIRTTDPAVVEAECRTLRQIGVNGLRSAPAFLIDMVAKNEGYAKEFHRARIVHGMGFPVPRVNARDPAKSDPEAGCPFAPGVAARTKLGIEETLAHTSHEPADEVWALTVDEIGAVFDAAPEGKAHVATCPHCAEGFREYLRQQKLAPADFGAKDWSEVSPINPVATDPPPAASLDRATGLRTYYTARFVNYATARLFSPLRMALADANHEKMVALQRGDTDSAAAKRPYIYSYALRGNTFLMGGHSLDFFEFYDHADNGFVYETSNRDPRIWHWDSHLCDVGRFVSAKERLQFGIYVKPHRGAPIQRALSSLSRGATMLYWYTYGPDWSKGDTFAADEDSLVAASKAARLIAASEEVLHGSEWAAPPEIAIVSPRSSEIWMRRAGTPPDCAAAWENAKWIYSALAHAHLRVDPIDEGLLETSSLKALQRYKVLYVNGPNLTAAAAAKVAEWVAAGGVLVTSGGGLRLDEANQPSAPMQELLGLTSRREPEMWKKVKLYGATALESYDDKSVSLADPPEGAEVVASKAFGGGFRPIVGREVLHPAEGTETLARFADGGAAATRHTHGKGTAYVVGLFPGLEYSAAQRTDHYDLRRDLDPIRRAFVTFPCANVVRPVVDCNHPTVEGVLVRNAKSGRRAVALMNWTYRIASFQVQGKARKPVAAFVPLEDVKVSIRAAGPVARVRDAATGEALPHEIEGDTTSVTLPRLDEAAVLLLE